MGRVKPLRFRDVLKGVDYMVHASPWMPSNQMVLISPSGWDDLLRDVDLLRYRGDPLWMWRYGPYPRSVEGAFIAATEHAVKNLTAAMSKRLEASLLYGGSPIDSTLWAWTYEFYKTRDPRTYSTAAIAGMLKQTWPIERPEVVFKAKYKETCMPTKKKPSKKTAVPHAPDPFNYGAAPAPKSDLDFYKDRCAELERGNALKDAQIAALKSALEIVAKANRGSSDY